MESINEGFRAAFSLIINLDRELLNIILLSLRVSGTALIIATAVGLPVGALTGLKKFPGRGLAVSILNTFTGLPPVVVGLFLYLLLSRSGPFGFMVLLYSPTAMIIAQSILAFPIVAAISNAAIVSIDPIIGYASRSLGATPFQASLTIIREARYGIMSGVITGFGRVMAEVGAVLMVGGNIAGFTRVMTTTIALETDKGNFELALALGIILLTLSLIINIALHSFQKKGAIKAER